ncbi:MAG: hypothetical protein U9O06_06515 [Euryarchaeota archaeon]|nr:hypothetical protein [Euryarchaeota archaeon]
MSASDGAGGGLSGLAGDARTLLNNPRGFILTVVVTWVVKNVFIKPAQWVLAMIDWLFGFLTGSLTDAQTTVLEGIAPVGDRLLALPVGIHNGLESVISRAGLAAPIVTSVAVVIEVVALVTIAYMVGRVLIDILPGGGGLIR